MPLLAPYGTPFKDWGGTDAVGPGSSIRFLCWDLLPLGAHAPGGPCCWRLSPLDVLAPGSSPASSSTAVAPEILLCLFLGAFVTAIRLSTVTSLAPSRVPLKDGGRAGGLDQRSSSLFLHGFFSISALSGTCPPSIFLATTFWFQESLSGVCLVLVGPFQGLGDRCPAAALLPYPAPSGEVLAKAFKTLTVSSLLLKLSVLLGAEEEPRWQIV